MIPSLRRTANCSWLNARDENEAQNSLFSLLNTCMQLRYHHLADEFLQSADLESRNLLQGGPEK